MALQSNRNKNWTYDRLKKELAMRYVKRIDEDEVERQLRETYQTAEQTHSAYYDQMYALALKLNLSEEETKKRSFESV